MKQSPYALDPNCAHERLVDTLPPFDFAALFIGLKRRTVCKQCATTPTEPTP